ncbi:hypothetical protein TRVA0_001S09626 [Trichomonascus vanleenenianus]|uniref:pepsin-like aspartic protease n=1 Tax=Trichomonascus vanleenenianus TaxID=2268995 RepID=UPI003EC95CFD
MKFSTTLITAIAAALVAAAPSKRSTPGVVQVPITHRTTPIVHKDTVKRSGYTEPLQNQVFDYVAELSIGTPAQTVECLLDTGSSDLWVYSNQAGVPDGFDSSSSSTYNYINDDFSIQYVSGSASGAWGSDTVTVAGASVTKQQFAAVDTEQQGMDVGIFGVGFVSGESGTEPSYPNFPQNLVNQGLISSNLYSLYLDDLDAQSGSILFGGVDTSKYTGSLATLPITSDNSLEISVTLEGKSFDAVLDSGTSLTYVPEAIAAKIAKQFGGTWDSSAGVYFIDSVPSESVTYTFGSTQVSIPPSELALNATLFENNPPKPYALSISRSDTTDGYNLLGDTFLRSAYVVYDLTNNEISVAQASYASGSDVVAISSKGVKASLH